jgi:hypothetical protein
MPYSTHLPEKMGHVELTPTGEFEAGSYASFTLTYTAGFYGIDDTGSLKLVMRFASDQGRIQFDDPKAPDYASVEATNGSVLEVRYDNKGNLRPWGKTVYIKVVRGYFAEGEQIIIRLGDTRQGSPGWRVQTFCEDTYEFRIVVDAFATVDYVVLPDCPTIKIVPGPPARWKAVLPTLRGVGEPFRLSLKAEDLWGNPTDQAEQKLLLRPSLAVAGLPETVDFTPGNKALHLDGLSVAEAGDLRVEVLGESGELLTASNPLRIAPNPPLLPFWGDLHGQSEETIGTNTARDYFTFGRELAFLDVCGHQGNDFQITREFWEELNGLTAELNQPGRFITLPGYEWSGNTCVGGDRNVNFLHEGRTIRRSSHALVADRSDVETDAPTAAHLFEHLQGENAVVFAHCGGRYADIKLAHDGRIERSVEIHSAWGTFEWLLHDAFEMGYRVGIVANSDGHKGRVGASYPGASLFGAYGGLTCMLMPELTREAVFDCLRRRHNYATTGNRMILDVRAAFRNGAQLFEEDPTLGPTDSREVDEAMMGDIVRHGGDSATLSIDVAGSAPIERVEIRNGLETLETIRPYEEAQLGARIRVIFQGAEYRGRFRMTAWDGTASLTGNRIRRIRAINFWNPENSLEQEGDTGLSWRFVTTGNFAGFDAWLENGTDGSLRIQTPHEQCEVSIAEVGLEPTVFDCGGLERKIAVSRLPDEMSVSDLRLERGIRLRPREDNPLYVCVTQEDGHQAWSSPIYLIP